MQNNDWQNFIYLALILVVLVSGLISRRDLDFKKIVKYLAIWSVIGFVTVALYAYRFEFSDFKTRILGEINPSAVRVGKTGELIVNLSEDGHFYLNVKINGTPVRFMIDTGASDIVLNLNEAKRLGIDVRELRFNKPYQTANGTSFGAMVLLNEIVVGDAVFRDVPASVNSAEMGTSLLGMSFLRQFNKYEFYRDRLVLEL